MPYVRTIPYREARGELKVVYDQMLQTRGSISNVMAVNSLRPHVLKTLVAHNASVMRSASGLSPAERQMIATVVSARNRCQY